MLAYSVFGEAGGPGKTTISASLAAAHARRGNDVLAIDLDPQNASLSYLYDVDDDRANSDADHLTRHLIDRPRGEFEDLIRTTDHGIDVVPAHNALTNMSDLLDRAQKMADDMGDDFEKYDRLRQVLLDAGIPDTYDVVIVDPSRTEGPGLYNAIAATRSLVVPAEATAKGKQSVEGLEDVVDGLENELEFNVGVLSVVPNKVDTRVKTQRSYLEDLKSFPYPVPDVVPIRGALFDGAWEHRCSPFKYAEEVRERVPERERETLETIENIAAAIESEAEA